MAEYHLIGDDGKEYGPYSKDHMKQLMADNRLRANSGVSVDGGEWKPFSDYPELGGSVPVALGSTPTASKAISVSAKSKVKAPAIFMIVVSTIIILSMLIVLLALLTDKVPPEVDELLRARGLSMVSFTLPILGNIIILVGAINMLKCQFYGLAIVASILCVLCDWSFFGLGVVSGIWSIVVLNNPEVRATFRQRPPI